MIHQTQKGTAVNEISLRNYFAGKALQGICATNPSKDWTDDEIAREAYSIANAMLKASREPTELPQAKAIPDAVFHANRRVEDVLDLVAIYAQQHAADIAALASRPVYAWCRMHVTPDNPSGPFEPEPDFSYGDDQPEGDGWFPLYR